MNHNQRVTWLCQVLWHVSGLGGAWLRVSETISKNGQLLPQLFPKKRSHPLATTRAETRTTRDPQKLLSTQNTRSDAVHLPIVIRADAITH